MTTNGGPDTDELIVDSFADVAINHDAAAIVRANYTPAPAAATAGWR